MSPEWTVQLRRYALVFLAPLALGAALGALYLTVRTPPLAGPCEMAYLLFVVLVWFGLLGYAVRELFAFFYLGRNALLQLAPGGRGRTLVRLSTVFVAYLLPLFAVTLTCGLAHAGRAGTRSFVWVATYYGLSKLVSLIAFFSLVCLLIVLVKRIPWTALALFAGLAAYAAITIGQGILLVRLLDRSGQHYEWAFGVSNSSVGVSQYLNALPLMVFGPQMRIFDDGVLPLSVALNAGLAVICLALTWLSLRRLRFDFVPR
jgi:hypothetical protein